MTTQASKQLINPPRCECKGAHIPGVLSCPSGDVPAHHPDFLIDCLKRVCAPAGWTLVDLCEWAAQRLSPEMSEQPIAWCSPITWNPRQSEMVRKLTRLPQPEYGFTVPLYTASPVETPSGSKVDLVRPEKATEQPRLGTPHPPSCACWECCK